MDSIRLIFEKSGMETIIPKEIKYEENSFSFLDRDTIRAGEKGEIFELGYPKNMSIPWKKWD